ncbi:unnamed protein product [Trichobilharzia regenti]|nr:unnamed protein product [Trichobilharzia regenti]
MNSFPVDGNNNNNNININHGLFPATPYTAAFNSTGFNFNNTPYYSTTTQPPLQMMTSFSNEQKQCELFQNNNNNNEFTNDAMEDGILHYTSNVCILNGINNNNNNNNMPNASAHVESNNNDDNNNNSNKLNSVTNTKNKTKGSSKNNIKQSDTQNKLKHPTNRKTLKNAKTKENIQSSITDSQSNQYKTLTTSESITPTNIPVTQPKKRGPKKKPLTKEREARLKNRRVRANAREQLLRRHVPTFSTSQRLSKIETLRLAKNYIRTLSQLLIANQPPTPLEMALNLTEGLSQNTSNLIANTLQVNPRILIQVQRENSYPQLNSESNTLDSTDYSHENVRTLNTPDHPQCESINSNQQNELLNTVHSDYDNQSIMNNEKYYDKLSTLPFINNQAVSHNSVVSNSWDHFTPGVVSSDDSSINNPNIFFPNPITDWSQSQLVILPPVIPPYSPMNTNHIHGSSRPVCNAVNENIITSNNNNNNSHENLFLQIMNNN